jgi:hypothetical protein
LKAGCHGQYRAIEDSRQKARRRGWLLITSFFDLQSDHSNQSFGFDSCHLAWHIAKIEKVIKDHRQKRLNFLINANNRCIS